MFNETRYNGGPDTEVDLIVITYGALTEIGKRIVYHHLLKEERMA
jgi:hypothetical protein